MTESASNKSTAFEHAKKDLQQAIEQLRTSEGFQRWLKAKESMPRYSWLNQIRVFVQDPDATLVRGKRQWAEDFNRTLDEWEPIWILAPMTKKVEENGEEERKVFFRAVKVFDVRHTSPDPDKPEVPLRLQLEPIEGDSHAWAIPGLIEHAGEIGYGVTFQYLGGVAGGFCDYTRKQIAVESSHSANSQVRTLCHELAHAHGIKSSDEGKEHAEACADASAHLACAAIGLDVSDSSVPYIADWAEAAPEVIESDLKRIQAIVNQLADAAGEPEKTKTPAPPAEVSSEASERLAGLPRPVEA